MSSCSRCADRLKNSGSWYFNKMINNSVHQDHLSMFFVPVEIFPAKMSCSIHCLFVRIILVGFHKHVEAFLSVSFLQVCRRHDRQWQRLINPVVVVSTPITQVTLPDGSAIRIHSCTQSAQKSVLFRKSRLASWCIFVLQMAYMFKRVYRW